MNDEAAEKLASAFERIGVALEGLNESARTAVAKLWPPPAEQREAIITRAETAEEKNLNEQGIVIPKGAVERWLSEPFGGEDDESQYVGEREREFIESQRAASAQAVSVSRTAGRSVEEAESEAGNAGEGTADKPPAQDS